MSYNPFANREGWPYFKEGDPVPSHCPVCGRSLIRRDWTAVDGTVRYFNLACDGGWPLYRFIDPTSGRHYTFCLGREEIESSRDWKFDKFTGEALR